MRATQSENGGGGMILSEVHSVGIQGAPERGVTRRRASVQSQSWSCQLYEGKGVSCAGRVGQAYHPCRQPHPAAWHISRTGAKLVSRLCRGTSP